tara:strand:- start:930 stop:3188 length:2259 start_codon:yes stop_codon:yes gene_type:complete
MDYVKSAPTADSENFQLFLLSDAGDFPALAPLKRPTAARVEYQQALKNAPINLPIRRLRGNARLHYKKPSARSADYFIYAYDGFMSGRRCTSPETLSEAERCVVSETKELLDAARGVKSLDGSMLPRKVSISLVIPISSISDPNAMRLIDGFSVYSDGKINESEVPITTVCRFTIYGGDHTEPIIDATRRSAFNEREITSISIVLRWAEIAPAGSENGVDFTVRTEFATINGLGGKDAATKIQEFVINIAEEYKIKLPPSMYAAVKVPSCIDGYYEYQLVKASQHFESLIYVEHPFKLTDEMTSSECARLQMMNNVFVRISSKERGVEGALSDSAMHAHLLCADGHMDDALEFVKQYRHGLPRVETTAYERLALHTCGVSVEITQFGGMISLYAHSGIPGKPISEPLTSLYLCKAAIVPLSSLHDQWDIYSCSSKSILPSVRNLGPSMISHFQRGLDLFNRTFSEDILTRRLDYKERVFSPCQHDHVIDTAREDDRFFMVAIGIDLRSRRACLGDTISRLMVDGAPNTLINMLVKVSMSVGLSASLQDTFERCIVSIDREECANDAHTLEVKRLKRVADAALLMGCNKKARIGVPRTTMKKVRMIMKLHSLQAGRTKCNLKNASVCPRDGDVSRSLTTTIYECYARRILPPQPHFDEVVSLVESCDDIITAICKSISLCMVDPGVLVEAFVLVHGEGKDGISVYEVVADESGCSMACGIGRIFEAENPAVMTIKWLSGDACIVTPLVICPAS